MALAPECSFSLVLLIVKLCFNASFSGLVPSLAALVQGVGGNPSCILKNKTDTNETDNTTTIVPELVPVYTGELINACFKAMISNHNRTSNEPSAVLVLGH